jgi:hypothetical protein
MRIRFYLPLLATLLLSFGIRAQTNVPATVTFGFGTNADSQLWDLTGNYSINATVNQHNGIQVPLTTVFSLVQDAAGNLHGVNGDIQQVTLGDSTSFAVTYTVNGRVTGAGGAARARFTVRMTGSGTVGLLGTVNFSGVLVVDAVPNPDDGELEGTAEFSAHLGGGLEGVNGVIPDFATPLPPGVDGTWSLDMQLMGGRSLNGSAVITTDAGQTMGFTVSGPLNAVGDSVIAKLRGSGAVANTSISGVGSSATINSDLAFDSFGFTGKLMGQKLSFPGP